MRSFTFSTIIIILLTLSACSHGNIISPDVPDVTENVSTGQSDMQGTSGHHILGAWELIFDMEAWTAEAVPLRGSDFHFNVTKFMEISPCTTCMRLKNFVPQGDHTFMIDVELEHPFPGLDNFSGFDVRGIAMFNGTYTFPGSGLTMSDHTLGNMELLNADGLTTLYNAIDFPPGSGPGIVTYNKGKKATLLSNPVKLNGYRAFFPDAQRRLFRSAETDLRTYHIAWPSGTLLRVGYVIDASWAPPLVKPVTNPLTDFGLNANCQEAYRIEALIGDGMMPGCGWAPFQVDVYDWQGMSTINSVILESPDLFIGTLTFTDKTDMGGFTRFTGLIPNENEVDAGTYRVLVGVRDNVTDPNMGTLTAYITTDAVVTGLEIDYEDGWRKYGRTLDNHNNNTNETSLSPTGLSEIWHHQFTVSPPFGVFDSTPTLGQFGVYVVADIPYAQEVWVFDQLNGGEVWHKMVKFQPGAYYYRSTVTVGNCEVFLGGSSLFSMDAEDGDQLWDFDGADTHFAWGGPVVVDGIVVAWGTDNTLYGVDALDGGFIWDYTTGVASANPGTVAYQNGVVYCSDYNGFAFALDITDGSQIWKTEEFPLGGPVLLNECFSSPVIAGGLVWVGCWNSHLYGLDMDTGAIIHNVDLMDQIPYAPPAFDGTYLYQPVTYHLAYWQFYEGPFGMHAIDMSGNIQWTYPGIDTEGFFSSPAIANGVVWLPSDAGVIYSLDPATGNPVGDGSYALDASTTGGLSIVDGRMYIMDAEGKLYCIGNE